MEKQLHSGRHLEQQFQPPDKVAINAGQWDTNMANLQTNRSYPVTQFQLGSKSGDDSMSIDSLTCDTFHLVKENDNFSDPIEHFSTGEFTNQGDRQSKVTTMSEPYGHVEIKETKTSADINGNNECCGVIQLPLDGYSEAMKKCTDGMYLGSKSDHSICESIPKGLKGLTNKNKSLDSAQIASIDAVSEQRDHGEMIEDIKSHGLTMEWPCEVCISALHFAALRQDCPTYALPESERSKTKWDTCDAEEEVFVDPKDLVECSLYSETMKNIHFPLNLTDSEARGCPEDDNACVVYNNFYNAASCDSELSLEEHPTNHRVIQPYREECTDGDDVADAKLHDYAHVSTKIHSKAIDSEAHSQAEHNQPCVEIYVRHLDFHKRCVQDNDASLLLDNPKQSTLTTNASHQKLDPLTTTWQGSQKDGLNQVPLANPTRMFETSIMVPDNSDRLEPRLSPLQSSELKPGSIYSHLSSYRYNRRTQFGLKVMVNLQILIIIFLALMLSKARHTSGVMVFLSVNALSLPGCAATSFSVIPSSQVVSVGEEAVFKCRHPTADLIDWLVNGSIVGINPPPDVLPGIVQTDNGTIVHTLTIVGRLEYNGTVVVCEAFFREGARSELSPEALFQVLLEIYTTTPLTTHSPTTPPPTTPPPTTSPPTTSPPTTSSPTTSSPTTPPLTVPPYTMSSAGKFVLLPVDQVVAQRQQAVFNCEHSTAHAIGWRLNGIPLLDTSLEGVEAKSTSLPGGVLNTLTVEGRPEYNMTRIECVAAFFDDSSSENTVAVTLIIQGRLDAVTSLASTRDPFLITWEPPFSLNLTSVEPDIVYCIEIILNCEEEVSVISDCNITTNYYDVRSLNPGYTYNITIIPRSNVDNALPGFPFVLEEKYALLLDSSISVSSDSSDNPDLSITINFEVTGTINPATYTLSLEAIDGEIDPESFSSLPVTNNIIAEDKGSVALKTSLPRRRLWWCTAFPNNCKDNQAISGVEELSTHDIQNVSVTSSERIGEVHVFGDFVTGTSANGAFVIIYSSELTRYHLAPRGDNGRLDTTVPNLPSGTYKVSVFTIEENGVPFGRVVIRPMSIDVTSEDNPGTQSAPHVIEYELASDSNFNGVNITCFFLNESTTDCVVIVHSMSSALTSSGVINISSYVFTRSEHDNSVSGYIQGVNREEYHFGVIGGELREDLETNVASNDLPVDAIVLGVIAAALAFVLFPVLMAIIFVVTVMKKHHTISRFRDYEPSVEKAENMYMTQIELINTHSGQTSRNSGAYQRSTDEEIVYDELTSPHTVTVQESGLNQSMQHERSQEIKYTSVAVACTTAGNKLDTHRENKTNIPDKTKVIYSDIRPDEKDEHSHMEPVQVSGQEEDCIENPVPVPIPFTVDNLFDQLWPLHNKWQKLGDVMSLPEDLLDEIFTNNEDNESCLRNLLEFYMKGERQHTWEEVHSFVKAVGDEDLADKIYSIHIQPYTPSKAEHCQSQVHGPLKPQDDSETWSSAVKKDSHSKAECYQPEPQVHGPQVHGPLKPKDESETWSSADKEVSVQASLFVPEPQVHGPLKPKDNSDTLSSASEQDASVQVPLFIPKPQVHGPLKPTDNSETLSSADEIKVSVPVTPLMPEPQVHEPLRPKDNTETLSGAVEGDVTKVSVSVPPFIPEGVYQSKSEHQLQSPSCSASAVKVCNQTTDDTGIATDHVTLREKKDRPVGFQTSYTPLRYCISWPTSAASSTYHCSVERTSLPAGKPREDTYSESVNCERHCDHLLHNTNFNNMSQSRASAPFILMSRGSLQSSKKVDQPLTQSHGCITVDGCNWNNVNDVGRAVSCSAIKTLKFEDTKDEPKVDLSSENGDRSQLLSLKSSVQVPRQTRRVEDLREPLEKASLAQVIDTKSTENVQLFPTYFEDSQAKAAVTNCVSVGSSSELCYHKVKVYTLYRQNYDMLTKARDYLHYLKESGGAVCEVHDNEDVSSSLVTEPVKTENKMVDESFESETSVKPQRHVPVSIWQCEADKIILCLWIIWKLLLYDALAKSLFILVYDIYMTDVTFDTNGVTF